MIDFSKESSLCAHTKKSAKAPDCDPLNTRKKRRAAVNDIFIRLNAIMDAEERYRDSVLENLQGTKWHEASDESIAIIQEAIDLIADIYL